MIGMEIQSHTSACDRVIYEDRIISMLSGQSASTSRDGRSENRFSDAFCGD
jgi:hypothetical protein